MDKVKEYENKLNIELSKFDFIVQLEKKTGVRKSYVVVGAVSAILLLTVLNIGAQLLVNLIGFIYPMWASLVAIKSQAKEDDTQWLTYWTVYGFLSILDYFSGFILHYVPFYYLFKLVVVLYLALPQFRGAALVYERFLKDIPLDRQSVGASVNAALNKEKEKSKDK